jgi:hypothetical protein
MTNNKLELKKHLETYLRPFMTQEEWEKDEEYIYERILNNQERKELVLVSNKPYNILDVGINWYRTKQGHSYWSKLHEKIKVRYIESRS